MRHSRAILYVEGYELDDLTPRLKTRLEAHLAGCRECAERSRAASQFLSLLTVMPPALPERFERAVETMRRQTLATTLAEGAPARRVGWGIGPPMPRPLSAVVGLAAMLAMVFLLQPLRREAASSPDLSSSARAEAEQVRSAHNFKIVRIGSEVKIEWPHNGRGHRIRAATDPASVIRASAREVSGKVWTDPAAPPAPGTITYYLID